MRDFFFSFTSRVIIKTGKKKNLCGKERRSGTSAAFRGQIGVGADIHNAAKYQANTGFVQHRTPLAGLEPRLQAVWASQWETWGNTCKKGTSQRWRRLSRGWGTTGTSSEVAITARSARRFDMHESISLWMPIFKMGSRTSDSISIMKTIISHCVIGFSSEGPFVTVPCHPLRRTSQWQRTRHNLLSPRCCGLECVCVEGACRNEDGASDLRAENNGDRGDKTQLMNKAGGTKGSRGRRRRLSSSMEKVDEWGLGIGKLHRWELHSLQRYTGSPRLSNTNCSDLKVETFLNR